MGQFSEDMELEAEVPVPKVSESHHSDQATHCHTAKLLLYKQANVAILASTVYTPIFSQKTPYSSYFYMHSLFFSSWNQINHSFDSVWCCQSTACKQDRKVTVAYRAIPWHTFLTVSFVAAPCQGILSVIVLLVQRHPTSQDGRHKTTTLTCSNVDTFYPLSVFCVTCAISFYVGATEITDRRVSALHRCISLHSRRWCTCLFTPL
ncbi:hypothetical protein RvY_08964-2 [Ramazzottius varieornatus]|uniref:Uncharacterized protein n=1 Tax=Ramazzottius varieornatus TaxID=947166 RepID=A0A1D1VDA8_RAMVA|nr:hypothetical protein RvY_08964-2 [Ramazzottius varieornatus]